MVINMRKEADGYFTVEAAMVMPLVFGVILMVLYLLFFQYNRCVLELELGVFALRGSLLETESNEDRAEKLQQQAMEQNEERYIAWECGDIQWKLERGTLQAEQQGVLLFPFAKERWNARGSYRNQIISPVSFLRYYRKW